MNFRYTFFFLCNISKFNQFFFWQGVRIGIVIFNDDIQYFDNCFSLHKTYIISNGIVQEISPKYLSPHLKFELVLKKDTIVKKAPTPIVEDNIRYDFMDFEDIDINVHDKSWIGMDFFNT